MRRSRPWIAPIGLVLSLFLLSACGGGGGTTDTAQGGSSASDAWQAGGGAEWTKVLEAGRKEGSVVVAGPAQLGDPLSEAFQRDTGIKLTWLGGSGSDNSARLEQEARAGKLTIDVSLGGGRELTTLKPAGLLQPIKPQLILPGVKEGSQWRGGRTKWYDNDGQFLLVMSEWVYGWPLVNAEKVEPSSIRNWNDLLKPEFKGKIIAYDPTTNGPGQGATGFLSRALGLDYLRKLFVDQDVTFVTDNQQLIEAVARGTKPIGLFAIQSFIEQFKKEGFDLQVVLPSDHPGYLTSGFSVLKEPKGVPHPNAAQVFINWYASQPGQTVYSSTMLEASRRLDVNLPDVPDYVKPKAGVRYDETDVSEDFYVGERQKAIKQITDLLGGR
jgi:ABC-type Fe3+ transport system substrate-binding protein